MLVVADTSPIHILVRIDHIDILPLLFKNVLIPSRVNEELRRAKYQAIQDFVASMPAWLQVVDPVAVESIPSIDPGEEAAISLARELKADALLIDDHNARQEALRRGLRIVGTLGILERAHHIGHLDLKDAINRIRQTDFRVTEQLLQSILHRNYPPRTT